MTIKKIKKDGKPTKFKYQLSQLPAGSIIIPKKNVKKLIEIERKEKINLI